MSTAPAPREIPGVKDLRKTELGYSNNYADLTLSSAFQPIFSVPHRRAVGFEGLIRARDEFGQVVSPQQVLRIPTCVKEHLELDRTCRWLHAHNFSRQAPDNTWLFLNLDTQSLVAERPDAGFMRELFQESGLISRQIVIEILENQIEGLRYLKELIHHFRNLGCLIAIDDFGAGHSNFDRIWELHPDIVKIDRNLVRQAAISPKVERILTGIVSLIHETGSLVVVEGVETEQEALVAISSNADMIQGFYFAQPHFAISANYGFAGMMEQLQQQQNVERKQGNLLRQQQFEQFRQLFEQEVLGIKQNHAFDQCGELVFKDERVVSCYLLNEDGFQIGKSIYSPNNRAQLDLRFVPLQSSDQSNWSHRHYHYRAMHNPGVTQISRPYHSVAGSHMCVTVSQAILIDDKWHVVCCDLAWSDEQQSLI